jgi:hypothetical protein
LRGLSTNYGVKAIFRIVQKLGNSFYLTENILLGGFAHAGDCFVMLLICKGDVILRLYAASL